MSQVSSGQICLSDAVIKRLFQLIETQLERMIQRRRLWDDVCEAGTQQAGIGASEEESHAPAEVGDLVTMGIWKA